MSVNLKTRLAVAALSLSVAGVTFIKGWEGTETEAYLDSVGVPTICTGSTRDVFIGQKATMQECDVRLVQDSTYAGQSIQRNVHTRLTQEQYDALVSFVFNVGSGAFSRSTMLKYINSGQCHAAADEFKKWVYAGKKKLRGLVNRRAAEAALFRKGCE